MGRGRRAAGEVVRRGGSRTRCPVDRATVLGHDSAMLNQQAYELFRAASERSVRDRMELHEVAGASVLDAGVATAGSLQAGLLLARLCLADAAEVTLLPADPSQHFSDSGIFTRSDDPVRACLGCQYAGWPVQVGDFFAMGSGPMRLFRGREEVLKKLNLNEGGDHIVGVLESDKLPSEAVVREIAQQCGVQPAGVHLAIAPSTSLAGSVQVVARSVETAMHKLHALDFDVHRIISAVGFAPLPPPAKAGDTIAGIGRTNDAMLYGARVTLWADCDDEAIETVADRVPSCASSDHGHPFAEIFKAYNYDFYKVDPLLFSPAVVTIHSLRSGRTWTSGQVEPEVLRKSFWT